MPLPVSPEITQNNPHLEVIYATNDKGKAGYFLRCNLFPDNSQKDPTDFSDHCQQVAGLTLNTDFVNNFLVFKEFVLRSPTSCAECPIYRQYLEQISIQSTSNSKPQVFNK